MLHVKTVGAALVAAFANLLLPGCSNSPPETPVATAASTNAVASPSPASAAPAPATGMGATNAAQTADQPEPPSPAVVGFAFDEDEISLRFSDAVNLVELKDYVKVSPNPGPLTQQWTPWTKTCRLAGRFLPRVTYTVTVRAGLPFADGRATVREFRRTWTAPDRSASVEFASDGRYLPAYGRRAVAVKSVNVTNLVVGVSAVPSRNVVQLLAREEDVYRCYYGGGGDSRDTEELAAAVTSRTVRVDARLNEEATTFVDLRDARDVAANGIYLVSVRDEGAKSEWQTQWKLVCVTDIGLSVREVGETVCVWATSLATGTPIPGLRVRVFDVKGVERAVGTTGPDGLFRATSDEPAFAVLAETADGGDRAFLALRRGALNETASLGDRRPFTEPDGSEAFVWTDRGIYRHGEKIFVHAILRNGRGDAPKPFPVRLVLCDPKGRDFLRQTRVTDRFGAVSFAEFAVPDDQPSGRWDVLVMTPEEDGDVLGGRTVKVEEFVPPQIRVTVTPPAAGGRAGTNLAFRVAGEHLFGGPTKGLPAEGAVRFADVPFAPTNWPGFRFGDATRGIGPNFETLDVRRTDAQGAATFTIDFPKAARPRAAVEMTVQGSVFEGGGRPVTARAKTVLHYYPYYVGVALPDSVRESSTPQACRVALVNPDGTPHVGARRLVARYERIERVFGLQQAGDGRWEWRSDTVREPFGEDAVVAVGEDGRATLALPAAYAGDIAVRLVDEEAGVSFGATYWVGGAGDDAVRTPLENPSRVTLTLDKNAYFPGERPRLTVKAPFAGAAWLSLLRDGELLATRVLALTNATSEVALDPVEAAWLPSVDVALSVVQAARPGGRAVANRAYGLVPMRVATRDQSLTVAVAADVAVAPAGGATVRATVRATPADGAPLPSPLTAAITVVDEGINLLTDEPVPDPVAWFGEMRDAPHPIRDVFDRLLPIYEDGLRRAGVKTGGGADGDLFRRLSPVPTRRFKPLSLWQADVPLADGAATATFSLPEFVGEVRVTAVVCGTRATGSGAVQAKVAPRLVQQPDAPRFAAPGDTFLATLTLANRSGGAGSLSYEVTADGAASLAVPNVRDTLSLADGQSETIAIPVRAGAQPGEARLVFTSRGFGETHTGEILVPVRPATPWATTATTFRLAPGERKTVPNPSATLPGATRRTFVVTASPLAQLASALAFLVEYPYGCLEQTVARVFPLVTAGGILNTLPVRETSAAADAEGAVAAGIRRVCSMIRANDFVMWPDGTTAPWDREVSLAAAQFLVEANANGFAVPGDSLAAVRGFLRKWAQSANATESVAACRTLACAGAADRDRCLFWYDRRATLDVRDRARLARAFVKTGDRDRARTLLTDLAPTDVDETAAALLAWLDLDPEDAGVPSLVAALLSQRDAANAHWGTTAANAQALLALGAYYRRELAAAPRAAKAPAAVRLSSPDGAASAMLRPGAAATRTGLADLALENSGDALAFVSVRTCALGDLTASADEAHGIAIARRYRRTDGSATDLSDVVRGEMLVAELTLSAPAAQTYSDLVVEDLLPACFEPDATPVTRAAFPWATGGAAWVLRRELRDDRVLGFSRRFALKAGECVTFRYAVRVVSAGDFVLPGPSVEAMYAPSVRARGASSRIVVAQ